MSFKERIEYTLADGSPSACPFIRLTKKQFSAYYHGCGLVIVAEQHGFVMDIIYIVQDIANNNIPAQKIPQFLETVFKQMPIKNSENIKFWLCMASAGELCEPRQITPLNIASIIKRIYEETQSDCPL